MTTNPETEAFAAALMRTASWAAAMKDCPPGLTPAGDGIYYGTGRALPEGWWWRTFTDLAQGWSPWTTPPHEDVVLQCKPGPPVTPRGVIAAMVAEHPDASPEHVADVVLNALATTGFVIGEAP